MNAKKIMSWLLFLFGESLIIAAFISFRGTLPDNILVLNIAVATIVYGLFFVDILVPWIDFKDKAQRKVGSMGVRWLVTWLYAIAAIAVIVVANGIYGWLFSIQLIIHGVLLFLLFLGLLGALHVSDKIAQVYQIEIANRSGITEMRKAMVNLKDKIHETANLPEDFIRKVNALEESLRFLSPTENGEAHELERTFIDTVHAIGFALTNYSLNKQQIEDNLKKCERFYQNRKQIYSN